MKLIYKSKYPKNHRRYLPVGLAKPFSIQHLCENSLKLQAQEHGRVTAKQFLAFIQTANKIIKKVGKLRILITPNRGVTKKPKEVRMGKGKGNVDRWVAKIKTGAILCEIFSMELDAAILALSSAQQKLPIKTKIF